MDYLDWQNDWEKLVDKWSNTGYECLTPDERIWFNVRSLIDAVSNGGLISFYYNPGADYLDETIEDLHKLGEQQVVNLIKKINKLFPNSKPPRDIDKRNEIIDSWDDKNEELFETVDSHFYELEEDLELKLEPIIKRIIPHIE